MDQSATSKLCPFCGREFVRLGNNLKHCSERQGRDHDHLLSQKTLSKKAGKKQKVTCPKCGDTFDRLDTHLWTSAICKDTSTQLPMTDAIPAMPIPDPVPHNPPATPTTAPVSAPASAPTTAPASAPPTVPVSAPYTVCAQTKLSPTKLSRMEDFHNFRGFYFRGCSGPQY